MIDRSSASLRGLLIIVGVVALIIVGNWLYWIGAGSPGTPGEFRDRVTATGLVVEWTRSGPSGGDGTATRDCGMQVVSVVEIDEALWLVWDEQRELLTPDSARAFAACELG